MASQRLVNVLIHLHLYLVYVITRKAFNIKSSSHIIFDFTLLFITLYYLNIPFITFSTSSNDTFSIRDT